MKAMNKAIRVISILMLVVLFVGAFSVPALATSTSSSTYGGIIQDMKTESENTNADTSGVTKLFGGIIQIMQVIGTGIAIIMLIVLAIKYLTASPEGKGEVKKSAAMYIVSAIVLFAAVNILAAIEGLAQGIVD
ncbi:MAG: hypothetical protein IJ223_00535 [Clostridia bacterium]|nr:hypothetical protein [Clostridia bacterium]